MDLAAHGVGQGGVDQALALDPAGTPEAGRDDEGAEVSTPLSCPGVSGVQVALVHDLDGVGVEILAQALLDVLAAIHADLR